MSTDLETTGDCVRPERDRWTGPAVLRTKPNSDGAFVLYSLEPRHTTHPSWKTEYLSPRLFSLVVSFLLFRWTFPLAPVGRRRRTVGEKRTEKTVI